jgi:copper chaperone
MSSTLERATLITPDISCEHCVMTIEKALGALDGVRRVQANEQTRQVQVEFDPGRVTLTRIEAVLDDEGYPVAK